MAAGRARAPRTVLRFGTALYRTYDPRARILREMAKSAAPELHRTAARTEEVALQILHEVAPRATQRDPTSISGLGGADRRGIPKELFTCLFAHLARDGLDRARFGIPSRTCASSDQRRYGPVRSPQETRNPRLR